MSSLRNAVQRRNHRERAQPAERAKWGLLEKRKDYKLRAADHKTKQRKITALKQKASERNEDEFYFSMVNQSSVGGIKRAKRGEDNSGGGGKSLDDEVVKLMKTQDQAYLQTMLTKCKHERERVEHEVIAGEVGIMLSRTSDGYKTNFNEDENEVAPTLSIGDDDDSESAMDLEDSVDKTGAERDTLDRSKNEDVIPEHSRLKRRKQHALSAKRRRLEALREQEDKLSTALSKIEQNRANMAGIAGGVNKNGVKFKQRQRKR